MEVTPAQAADWLATRAYRSQRTLRAYHVQYLATVMARGHWRRSTTVDFALRDGQYLLVNGQHTLAAIVRCGTLQAVVVTETPCATLENVAALYASHDVNLRRSIRDRYSAMELAAELGLSSTDLEALGGAIPILASGFAGWHGRNEPYAAYFSDLTIRAELMRDWKDEAHAYFVAAPMGRQSIRALLRRVGVLAVGLVTFRYQPEKAQEFWYSILRDDGLTANDPRKRLLVFLQDHEVRKYIPEVYPRYSATAWNAFFAGKLLHNPLQINRAAALTLAGTPHRGRVGQIWRYLDPEGVIHHDPLPRQAPATGEGKG